MQSFEPELLSLVLLLLVCNTACVMSVHHSASGDGTSVWSVSGTTKCAVPRCYRLLL